MNPLHHPAIVYLRAVLGDRVRRARDAEDKSLGVSAIEWAIITGMLAVIAIGVFAIIRSAVTDKANEIQGRTGY